jgi:hypothetical protein
MTIESTNNKVQPIVFIKDEQDAEGPYVVVPGKPLAQPGDHVRFQNCTDVDVEVTFDDPSLFGTSGFTLAPKDKEQVTVNAVTTGGYPYVALCGPSKTPAHGSRPIIIIYD